METSVASGAGVLPGWFRQEIPEPAALERMRSVLRGAGLHTVCEGARCPNLGRCWNRGAATFMILGDTCTRACRFCAVNSGAPSALDAAEPMSIAGAVKALGLRYVVITSVTRDDLADEGAGQFARTVRAVKAASGQTKVEVLVPDLHGRPELIKVILDAKPDVLGHNIETVPRLAPVLRPQADHERSLKMLATARGQNSGALIKSGLMVGLGETDAEVLATICELKAAGCDIVTVGQYLAPTREERHVPVDRYVPPEQFERYRAAGLQAGLEAVVAGPLVRSSYLAEQGLQAVLNNKGKGKL
ncbi:MAG: lipoyl synthase [Candidatus Omnitrophica bacterium]|nr:lipoyl synthase [Candidatus Omnitrophota bacterium]